MPAIPPVRSAFADWNEIKWDIEELFNLHSICLSLSVCLSSIHTHTHAHTHKRKRRNNEMNLRPDHEEQIQIQIRRERETPSSPATTIDSGGMNRIKSNHRSCCPDRCDAIKILKKVNSPLFLINLLWITVVGAVVGLSLSLCVSSLIFHSRMTAWHGTYQTGREWGSTNKWKPQEDWIHQIFQSWNSLPSGKKSEDKIMTDWLKCSFLRYTDGFEMWRIHAIDEVSKTKSSSFAERQHSTAAMESFFPGKKVLQNRRYQTKTKSEGEDEMKWPLLLTQVLRHDCSPLSNYKQQIAYFSTISTYRFSSFKFPREGKGISRVMWKATEEAKDK